MPRLARRNRAPMFGGADDETVKDVAGQSPAVGMGDMGDPALDAGIQLGEADFGQGSAKADRVSTPSPRFAGRGQG
jgi:hypothetical protein